MKAVIQRVKQAEVASEEEVLGQIKKGMVVLLGIEEDDNKEMVQELADEVLNLRIFPSLPCLPAGEAAGKASADKNIDRSVKKVSGDILVVSQFTLCADTSKGNRPSFVHAASPEKAKKLYNNFITYLQDNSELKIETGKFGAMMEVSLVNDGPVTIILSE